MAADFFEPDLVPEMLVTDVAKSVGSGAVTAIVRFVRLGRVGVGGLQALADADRQILKRINTLIDACLREPCAGIGKPEQLKYGAHGAWSRRITE